MLMLTISLRTEIVIPTARKGRYIYVHIFLSLVLVFLSCDMKLTSSQSCHLPKERFYAAIVFSNAECNGYFSISNLTSQQQQSSSDQKKPQQLTFTQKPSELKSHNDTAPTLVQPYSTDAES